MTSTAATKHSGRTLPSGNRVNAQKGTTMARTRYQKGSLKLLGPQGRQYWQGRFRESYSVEGRRPDRKVIVGWLSEFPTKKLAQRELDRRFLNAVNDAHAPTTAVTFKAAVQWWEQNILSQYKPSSQSSMKSEVKHLQAYFGEMLLSGITGAHLQEFVASLDVSPKYAKNLLADFKVIWNSALSRGLVTHQPSLAVRLPKVHAVQAPAFTADEARQIIEAAEEPYRTMYWLAASLGPRGGEICGLRVRSLDFLNHQVQVSESVWNGKAQSPKTGNGIRTLCMSPELGAHLMEFVRGKNPDDLLFSKNGKPYRQDGVQRYHLKPLLKRMRIACTVGVEGGKEVVTVKPDYGLHAFRHLNATMLDRVGATAAVRRGRLGHGNLSTTMNYTHIHSSDDQKAALDVEALIMGRVQ